MIKPLSVLESRALGLNHLSNTVALGIRFPHRELQRTLFKPPAAEAFLLEALFEKCESPKAILTGPHLAGCKL